MKKEMKKEEIEKMDVNNPDYWYTDVVEIPNVEEQLNDIVFSDVNSNTACLLYIVVLLVICGTTSPILAPT